jgi:uncharacterized protein with NRDE domain
MCTLVVIDRVVPGYPIIAAANRDEFYGRPASAPRILAEGPRIIGPRDEMAGGTWIGVGEGGLFAGLTNRPDGETRDPSRRSRGEVTLAALRGPTVSRALEALGAIPPKRYQGFHLYCAGPDGAGLVVYGPESAVVPVAPGLHVITNRGMDLEGDPKTTRIRAHLGDVGTLRSLDEAFARLEGALRDHAGANLLERVCIHGESYGTRSGSLIALHESDRGRSRYLHAEGRPCETPWEDASVLLGTTRAAAAWAGGIG